MSVPPQNPQPADDDGWQSPDSPASGDPSPDAPASAPEAPSADAAADRPPPYQGSYGAQPGQAPPQPGFAPPGQPAPGQPPAGLPQYPQSGHGQPTWGQPAYSPPGAPGQGGPNDWLAGRGARLGAGLLDALIVGFASLPFLLQAIRWDKVADSADTGESLSPSEMYNIPRLFAGYAIVFLLGFAYYSIMHAKSGQTVGKRAVGIRLVRASDYAAVSWGQVCARQGFVYALTIAAAVLNALGPVGTLVGIASLLDNAWILWDPRKQAVHDKVAGTVVVKAAPWLPNPYAKS
ncbi:RDD family protein [Actinomadura rubrisoli]|uniref:RDD family protein n=1 Tax=Actinomadura rubrisoli TaxID=2530368 RepID=A0A4R5ALA8_9ACTN|nr:RDD family protein [Actinomadura rubrisoli]TDD73748.1 RDD family protein [Actinomadura rubrisoli]